jgi:carboxypeptidase Q
MNAKTALKSQVSRNIIVELKGRETPDEVIAIGGHIDSWDVGVGAVDDGAGCFIAWEALRQLSKLDRPPRRTVRAVFWTSEENGSPGGRVYAANHPETNTTRHVFAFESDNGVFDPYGIKFTAGRRSQEEEEETKFNSFDFMTAAGEHFLGSRKDLSYAGAGKIVLPEGGGADIAPLCKQGVACAHFTPADPFPLAYSTSPYYIKSSELATKGSRGRHGRHHRHHHDDSIDPPRRPVDSGYFYYHHTEADSMGAFTPDQVKNSAAVMAIWTYIAAESQVEL